MKRASSPFASQSASAATAASRSDKGSISARVIAEDVRSDLLLLTGSGMADPDADPAKVRAQRGVDRAQAVVARKPAADADLHLERGEIELVVEDGERFLVELVEMQRLLNCVAAVVHEGLRLQQQHPVPADAALSNQASEFFLPRPEVVNLGDEVGSHHPDIVPVKRIFRAGISEAHPNLHRRHLA
jgi:hypothetical protein